MKQLLFKQAIMNISTVPVDEDYLVDFVSQATRKISRSVQWIPFLIQPTNFSDIILNPQYSGSFHVNICRSFKRVRIQSDGRGFSN